MDTKVAKFISVNILFLSSGEGTNLKTVLTSIILSLNFLLLTSKFKLYFDISFSSITYAWGLGISKEISFINFDSIL